MTKNKSKIKKQDVEKDSIGGRAKEFIQKLSRGLMIPIALLPIAGLFLGVGAGFENVIKQAMEGADPVDIANAAYVFTIFKMIGDAIFGNLPILFALGVAVAFSEDVGIALFSALVAWITFNATQSTLIWDYGHIQELYGDGTHLAEGNLREITNWGSTYLGEDGNLLNGYEFVTDSYSVGPWMNGSVPAAVVATNLGITSMQTSVFGGILIGFYAAFMYNKFSKVQMPKVLGFFSGTRFVPIITFLTVPIIGFAFILVWPAIGIGLNYMGSALGQVPYGFDAFIFGVIERSLIPFGLHHAFYAPLWYTTVGGAMYATDGFSLGELVYQGDQGIWFGMQALGIPFSDLGDIVHHNQFVGQIVEDGVKYDVLTASDGSLYAITHGINPGQYQQGKYPFMLLGLPAAAAAMIFAAKKENRQVAMSVIGAAGVTSFLTGITEPIEFTFLFLAPYLYYGFHIWMAGISFWLMDALGSHVGMTFSGGIFDYVLFGILPDATGLHSNSWWIPSLAVIYAPIYFIVFYTAIIKFDIKTPGRADGELKMVSKADYKESKGGSSKASSKKDKANDRIERVLELEKNLGGLENLTSIEACITRLRLSVADRSKVNDDALVAMGAQGVVGKGKAIQIIFGAEADVFRGELKELRKDRENGTAPAAIGLDVDEKEEKKPATAKPAAKKTSTTQKKSTTTKKPSTTTTNKKPSTTKKTTNNSKITKKPTTKK